MVLLHLKKVIGYVDNNVEISDGKIIFLQLY